MDSIPSRGALATPYRTLLNFFEQRVSLPDLNPSYYHAFGTVLSVLYLYSWNSWTKILIVFLVIFADWLDGATARQFGKGGRAGYMIDVVTDRVSEALIFAAEAGTLLGQIFFLSWIVNLLLAYYSVYSNKHTSLPLRFAFLAVLFVQAVG